MSSKEHPKLPSDGNGWTIWGKHILLELERQDRCAIALTIVVNKLQIENAVLRIKSGIWGVIGASIPILIAFILWLIKSNVLIK